MKTHGPRRNKKPRAHKGCMAATVNPWWKSARVKSARSREPPYLKWHNFCLVPLNSIGNLITKPDKAVHQYLLMIWSRYVSTYKLCIQTTCWLLPSEWSWASLWWEARHRRTSPSRIGERSSRKAWHRIHRRTRPTITGRIRTDWAAWKPNMPRFALKYCILEGYWSLWN